MPVFWTKDASSNDSVTLTFFLGWTASTNVESGVVSFHFVALKILPEEDFFGGGSGDSDILMAIGYLFSGYVRVYLRQI